MAAHNEEDALVAALAADLTACRQRGLADLNLNTYKKPRKHIPTLERLAHTYGLTKGMSARGRVAEIRTLLQDGLAAYAAQGCEPESHFIDSLFFDRSGGRAAETSGALLDTARHASGMDKDRFDDYRRTVFADFAAFLIAFVPADREAVGAALDLNTADSTVAQADPDLTRASSTPQSGTPVSNTVNALRSKWRQSSLLRGTATIASALVIAGLVVTLILTDMHALSIRPSTAAATATSGPLGHTYVEVAGEFGSPTFTDPHRPAAMGARIQPYERIQVSCKVFAPTIPSISPDGYWYRVANPKYADAPYTPAANFLNGDPAIGARKHYTDFAVPDCSS